MEKPIIRHCQNCQWYEKNICGDKQCAVRYKRVLHERLRAWLCRFYKQREEQWADSQK